MKIAIESVGTYVQGDSTLVVDSTNNKIRLVAKYPSRDQSTSLLTRHQALQLAGALQTLAWGLGKTD